MFRDHIRKLRPVQESYKPPVDKLQLFFEQKGLDIATLKKEHPTSGKLRLHILIDVINDKTPIDTKIGKTSISWINNADKVALESGDMITSFLLGKRYKQVFVSDTGKKLRLNDLIKTDMFGGGRGSGGGAEQTALMECAQCVYAAAIFGGERLNEIDGKDYYFINKKKFQTLKKNNFFIETATNFNNLYGSPIKNIILSKKRNKHILFDIDWKGARKIRRNYIKDDIIDFFILPPSISELKRRLIKRGRDNKKEIDLRLSYAIEEMKHYNEYKYVLINEKVHKTVNEIKKIIEYHQLIMDHKKVLRSKLKKIINRN